MLPANQLSNPTSSLIVALASANQPYLALDDLKLAGPALKNSTKGWICVGHCRAVTDNTEGAQQAFEEALKHITSHADDVWFGTGKEIARHFIDHYWDQTIADIKARSVATGGTGFRP